MTRQITLKELLKLVTVGQAFNGDWYIVDVKGNVSGDVKGFVLGDVEGDIEGDVKGHVDGNVKGNVGGNVKGNVGGNVEGEVCGDVGGNVCGKVYGNVGGTINGKEWQSIETPKDKLQRLIEESGDKELLEAFNQLEMVHD